MYGDISEHGFGTFAEYCAVHEDGLVPLPDGLSFASAAATPHAFELRVPGLRSASRSLKDRERVLLNGAGGGVGTFACSWPSARAARSGRGHRSQAGDHADARLHRVIDYKETDFTRLGERFDVVVT